MGNPASAPPAVAFCRWFLGPSPQNEIILDGIIWVIYNKWNIYGILYGIYYIRWDYMEYSHLYMEYIWNIYIYI